MTPKMKIFENVFPDSLTGHRTTFRDQIWWKSAVAKLPKGRVVYQTKKNSGSAGLVPANILAKMGWSRPKFPKRCHPLTYPRIPNLARIRCVLPDLFRKDWFFGPKSEYNNFFISFSLQLWVSKTIVSFCSAVSQKYLIFYASHSAKMNCYFTCQTLSKFSKNVLYNDERSCI